MEDYLKSLERFGMNLGLDRINYLLKRLGNPQNKFQSIHVAGTNGKGSTAAMIASILKNAKHKVGLYTSPHLFDFTDRINVNGKNISKVEFKNGMKKIQKISQRMKEPPTVFEVLTALAFMYFAKKKVKIAVVEVGLGGRLDATNVLTPLVTVITNIDLEHMEVLGKSLEKIAHEKTGVVKEKVPVVTAEQRPGILKYIKKVCDRHKSLLVQVDNDQSEIKSGLIGEHQQRNAACAIAAVRLSGLKVTPKAIDKGLKSINWPGRFQVLSKKPLIVVDGAHNPAAAKELRKTIDKKYAHKYTLIFGCQELKDFQAAFKELEPIADNIIITKSSHKMAADPRYVYNHFTRVKAPMSVTYSVKDALKLWNRRTPLLISGSLFVAGDALKSLKRVRK
jgi:dihydrofolate synthase / folylpolyglutamate synthase